MIFVVSIFGFLSCASSPWAITNDQADVPTRNTALQPILKPDPEDLPFFQAIAKGQSKVLESCQDKGDCQKPHFLRGLVLLYMDREAARSHFRQVVTAKPSSRLAAESRFWLWLLDSLNSEGTDVQITHVDFVRRLIREIVDREFIVYDLASKLEDSSIESLQLEVETRDKKVNELNQVVAALTKQVDLLKKEPAIRLALQKELDEREKKVEELMSQLEALRRIDQELKQKTPPTRPSEELTPSAEVEKISP
ncbi:MAG: hypothetical protein KC594_13510 [Nitrospira sp.]|nr:hypothetical protein [Nitrospira sp.]